MYFTIIYLVSHILVYKNITLVLWNLFVFWDVLLKTIVLYCIIMYCIVLYCIVLVSNLMSAVVWRILCVFFYSSQIMCKLSLAIHCGKKDIVLVPFIWSFSVMIYSLQIESQLSLAKAAVHIGCGTEDIVLVPFYPVLHWAACCVTGHQRTGENRTGSQTMDRDINIIPLNNF